MNTASQVARICARQLSRSAPRSASAEVQEVPSKNFKRLKELQKKFGIDDGTPVHLKGGFGDRILYITTASLVVGGTGLCVYQFYTMI